MRHLHQAQALFDGVVEGKLVWPYVRHSSRVSPGILCGVCVCPHGTAFPYTSP